MADIPIRRLERVDDEQIVALADVLIDAIDSDAGVSFLHPLEPVRAQAFWREVAEDVEAAGAPCSSQRTRTASSARCSSSSRSPRTSRTGPTCRRCSSTGAPAAAGLGAALLEAAEQTGRDCGKTLLVLDTNTGSDAERLYARMGWTRVGEIPDFSIQPRGGLRATTVFYKVL